MEAIPSLPEITVTTKLLISVIVLFFLYDWWCHQYFQRRGIRVGRYYPVIGSLMDVKQGIGYGFLVKNFNKNGRIFGWYECRSPMFVINDADILKHIFVKNFSQFVNRRTNMIRSKPLDKGLLALRDEHWKEVRSIVSPAFSAVKMKKMFAMISECCDTLVANVGQAAKEGKPVDCKKLYGGFTMDTVAWCGFGLKVDSQRKQDDEFVVTAKEAFDSQFVTKSVLLSVMFPPLIPVFEYLNLGHMPSHVMSFFRGVTEQACRLRKDEGDCSNQIDMLQLLLNAHKDEADDTNEDMSDMGSQHKGKKRALTTEEVTAQAVTFFLAGYETTNALLGFVSFLLATHQDIQDRLYMEIEETSLTPDGVTYDTITKMTYLDMVINESLRRYPPAGGFVRTCNKTFTYDGITIEEGTRVLTSIWAIHHDEEYWPDPYIFDPERFSAERRPLIKPCAFLPFGCGPRNCIGMRFALLEAKIALVRVLQQYRLEVCPETKIPLELNVGPFASPREGIKLRPLPRKQF